MREMSEKNLVQKVTFFKTNVENIFASFEEGKRLVVLLHKFLSSDHSSLHDKSRNVFSGVMAELFETLAMGKR